MIAVRDDLKSSAQRVHVNRALSAAWPHAVGTIRSKLVFLINATRRTFARTLDRAAAERIGIDDESDQVT
jgi:hypothetical protein